jgi:hypothetical protein
MQWVPYAIRCGGVMHSLLTILYCQLLVGAAMRSDDHAVGWMQVGAATEVELKDKKLRYEDAINSVKNALRYGILPGTSRGRRKRTGMAMTTEDG